MAKQRDSVCFFILLLFFTKDLLIGKEFGKPFVLLNGGIRTHISANIGKQCQIISFAGERNANDSDGKLNGRRNVYIIREQNVMELSIKKDSHFETMWLQRQMGQTLSK